MLDYAANGVLYWTAEQIQARFEDRCRKSNLNPVEELELLLREDGDTELFWSKVKRNLRDGAVRLVFVADVIPSELRRVVEFLNTQMNPAEILAAEIRQYASKDFRTLVPRVVGQTAEAQRRKSAGQGESRLWDEASFFEACRKQNGEEASAVARRLLDWANASGRAWFGRGQRSGSFGHAMQVGGEDRYSFVARTSGTVEISLQWLRYAPPFNDESKRRTLVDRLNAIEGLSLPADRLDGRPSVKLAALAPPDRLQQFTAALDWVVAEIRAASAGGREPGPAG
jgi:hypothetical protein